MSGGEIMIIAMLTCYTIFSIHSTDSPLSVRFCSCDPEMQKRLIHIDSQYLLCAPAKQLIFCSRRNIWIHSAKLWSGRDEYVNACFMLIVVINYFVFFLLLLFQIHSFRVEAVRKSHYKFIEMQEMLMQIRSFPPFHFRFRRFCVYVKPFSICHLRCDRDGFLRGNPTAN